MRALTPLEMVSTEIPEGALEAYELALSSTCKSVAFFPGSREGYWRLEAIKPVGEAEPALISALVLAAGLSGTTAVLQRSPIPAGGWLQRNLASFPPQLIGQQFAVSGTHSPGTLSNRRVTLTLDAGLAFGSGEHGSTRGCLRALERICWRRPRRILDLGTGSGILAMAAARLLHRRILATDIDPWSVRVARQNARRNRLRHLTRFQVADGWRNRTVRREGPYDLVVANILARPLCAMAKPLSTCLAPGGTAILSGFLNTQAHSVAAAHRRRGLCLEVRLYEGPWVTLVVRRRSAD